MRFLDEYRDAKLVRRYAEAIRHATTRRWTLMEVCGGQTHAIVRFGLDQLLPDAVELVHGPGCPVCVTSLEVLDTAMAMARRPEVIFCTFGDMLRVPGSIEDLLSVRADGGDVRIVYSPLDAVTLARENPRRQVVFFAVGFETTAPANALAVLRAEALGLENFSVLVAQVLIPPAMEAILAAPDNRVQGFLAAGHVCAVTGYRTYEQLAARSRVPIVVTGFEPADLLQGVLQCVQQLEAGEARCENQYARVVRRDGNPSAWRAVERVFEVGPRAWRGMGAIPESGLNLRPAYARFDARRRFEGVNRTTHEHRECRAADVLRGACRPTDCAAFGTRCTPETPLGAPMVSTEGACAAYFRYGRRPAQRRPM